MRSSKRFSSCALAFSFALSCSADIDSSKALRLFCSFSCNTKLCPSSSTRFFKPSWIVFSSDSLNLIERSSRVRNANASAFVPLVSKSSSSPLILFFCEKLSICFFSSTSFLATDSLYAFSSTLFASSINAMRSFSVLPLSFDATTSLSIFTFDCSSDMAKAFSVSSKSRITSKSSCPCLTASLIEPPLINAPKASFKALTPFSTASAIGLNS